MKVNVLTFDPSIIGVAVLHNVEPTGSQVQDFVMTDIKLNTQNVGCYTTIQTIFTVESPVYNIEVNLGKIDTTLTTGGTQGQMIVDPDGWQLMPASILSPDSAMGLPIFFSAPFFAIRVNIKTAAGGTNPTGTIKVLQQGIM